MTALDIDRYLITRQAVLDAWHRWDEEPGNAARANAMADACVAYAGDAHVDFAKFIAAVRRGGGNHLSALNAWEADW
jgi:hypothetical protein